MVHQNANACEPGGKGLMAIRMFAYKFLKTFKKKKECRNGKHGEPANQENIFCGIYRCWLQPVVMKLYKNYTIYYFLRDGLEVYVKFSTFAGGEFTKIEQVKTRGEGGPNFILLLNLPFWSHKTMLPCLWPNIILVQIMFPCFWSDISSKFPCFWWYKVYKFSCLW